MRCRAGVEKQILRLRLLSLAPLGTGAAFAQDDRDLFSG
jgi:hypothetical protein